MTAVPPALPGTAQSKRLKESHEFTRLLLGKADMRVVKIQRLVPALARSGICDRRKWSFAGTQVILMTRLRVEAAASGLRSGRAFAPRPAGITL
jgi:hypothetical protein